MLRIAVKETFSLNQHCFFNSKLFFFLCRCDFIMDTSGNAQPFTVNDQEKTVSDVIEPMASNGLRTICMAYKDFVKGMQFLSCILRHSKSNA